MNSNFERSVSARTNQAGLFGVHVTAEKLLDVFTLWQELSITMLELKQEVSRLSIRGGERKCIDDPFAP